MQMCAVVTSSVPMMEILLSCGYVTANSLWKMYNNPKGPTTCGFREHSAAADSLKCGYCRKKECKSLGASSMGTPLIRRGILMSLKKKQLHFFSISLPFLSFIFLPGFYNTREFSPLSWSMLEQREITDFFKVEPFEKKKREAWFSSALNNAQLGREKMRAISRAISRYRTD